MSRFTIHLLNCYSFGANVAIADWRYVLPCFYGQIFTSHQLAAELHEMKMQTIVENATVTNLIPTNADKRERGEKLETHLAYHKNLFPQLTGNVADRNAWERGIPSLQTQRSG